MKEDADRPVGIPSVIGDRSPCGARDASLGLSGGCTTGVGVVACGGYRESV